MGMDFERRTQEIIEEAEKALAALAAEAASERDYPQASRLLGLAQRIASALGPAPAPRLEPLSMHTSGGARPHNGALQGEEPSMAVAIGKKVPARTYPRFKRDDDTLVKIGWSKSDRATYEHRSPRSILDRLVRRIQDVGAAGDRFTTEQILPLLDDENNELPSYQAYLCLAWLVIVGLLERHGRQGYTVSAEGDFQQAVQDQWGRLNTR
jgi:hypothetical protein